MSKANKDDSTTLAQTAAKARASSDLETLRTLKEANNLFYREKVLDD